jgi:hypothetical protein|tara:strand:- start:350 stop:559 length:210 start_codon:yes stop_codon:yes gene_type:complete
MHFDRFDIIQAYYLFFVDYHEGQTSKKYTRLCKIGKYYKPSSTFSGVDSLSENALAIYENLVAREEGKK